MKYIKIKKFSANIRVRIHCINILSCKEENDPLNLATYDPGDGARHFKIHAIS
jgi:hypothetical protein